MSTRPALRGPRDQVRARAGAGVSQGGVGGLLAPELVDLWQRSPTATLFQHPRLAHAWWQRFGANSGSTAWTWQLDDQASGAPIASAAWSIHRRALWFSTALRRLQLVGQATWLPGTFPAEYPSLLTGPLDDQALEACYRAALDATLEMDWDDLHFSWLVHDSPLDRALRSWAAERGLLHLAIGPDYTYAVSTRGAGAEYCASLSANARRALFGKWPAAERRGVRYEPGTLHDAASRLDVLYELHDRRWQGAGMVRGPREFLRQMVDETLIGVQPRISLLTCDGAPVSASLNVFAKGAVYNLQTGFDPASGGALPLGKLHHGREILRAFDDPDADRYDLLVGRGMKDDYKSMFATERKIVSTVWVIRSRLLRAALVGRRALGMLLGREYAPEHGEPRLPQRGQGSVTALRVARGEA
jgi:hypothetical protein